MMHARTALRGLIAKHSNHKHSVFTDVVHAWLWHWKSKCLDESDSAYLMQISDAVREWAESADANFVWMRLWFVS